MGGLYNVVFGNQPHAGVLLSLLNAVQHADFGRLRDAWVEIEGDWVSIRVHTRNGGGNRPDYQDAIKSMQSHPWYVRDQDMAFDPTYADFWFVPPHELRFTGELAGNEEKVMQLLASVAVPPVDMAARWQEAIDRISDR